MTNENCPKCKFPLLSRFGEPKVFPDMKGGAIFLCAQCYNWAMRACGGRPERVLELKGNND